MFACSAPWHAGQQPVGENMRELTDRYPPAWCAECCLEFAYAQVNPEGLTRVPPDDRPRVIRWLLHAGWERTAHALAVCPVTRPARLFDFRLAWRADLADLRRLLWTRREWAAVESRARNLAARVRPMESGVYGLAKVG